MSLTFYLGLPSNHAATTALRPLMGQPNIAFDEIVNRVRDAFDHQKDDAMVN